MIKLHFFLWEAPLVKKKLPPQAEVFLEMLPLVCHLLGSDVPLIWSHLPEECGVCQKVSTYRYYTSQSLLFSELERLKSTTRSDVSDIVSKANQLKSRTNKGLKHVEEEVKMVEGMTRKMEKKVLVMERSGGGARSHTTVALQQLDVQIRECDQVGRSRSRSRSRSS